MVLAGLVKVALLGLETESAVDAPNADAPLNESYAPPLLPAAGAVLAVMGSLASVLLLLLLDAAPSD